jgi:hypothetical protein
MEESMKRVREMKPPPENWEGMIEYRLEGLAIKRKHGSEYSEYFRSEDTVCDVRAHRRHHRLRTAEAGQFW